MDGLSVTLQALSNAMGPYAPRTIGALIIAVGGVVYWLVWLLAVAGSGRLAAQQPLRLDAVTQPASRLLQPGIAPIPRLIGAQFVVTIALLGKVLARLAAALFVALLGARLAAKAQKAVVGGGSAQAPRSGSGVAAQAGFFQFCHSHHAFEGCKK